MFGTLLGGLTGGGLGALGIGALIGGLSARQRGGNFLKGALTGAALGGITGVAGQALGGKGGLFGWGAKSKWGNLLPAAGILMGSEMMGQQEANRLALEGKRRMLDEEEERRIARLNKIAGYDVASSKNFLTPQSYFGAARGGLASLPHYANGGWHDVPMEEAGPTMDPEIMQLPMGQEGSFEEENEGIVGLELAGLTDDEMSELQALQSLSIVTPEDHPQYESIQLRLQELRGKLKAADGGYINRPGYDEGGITDIHPGTEDEGFTYDFDIDGEKYDFSFDERLTEASAPHPDEGYYDMFFDEHGRYPKDREELDIFLEGMDLDTFQAAHGGIADLDMRGGGHSIGPGIGTSDDVPAMLSDGEFVVTAKAVENLGGGDRMEGAKRMYSMMNQLDPQSQTPGEMNYVGHG